VQTALVTGDVDIVGGGAEFIVSHLMVDERPDLDWTLPKEDGIRWMQSITVLEQSGRKDLAMDFLRYIMSPDGQGRLAKSDCGPCRRAAVRRWRPTRRRRRAGTISRNI